MRVAFIFAALVAAVAALPSPPMAANSDVFERDFPEDDFEIKEEPDFMKRAFENDDFEIPDEPETKRRDIDPHADDFEIPDEADD